jgi:hypothetical protein
MKISLGSADEAGRMNVYGPGRFFFRILNSWRHRGDVVRGVEVTEDESRMKTRPTDRSMPEVYLSTVAKSGHMSDIGFLHDSNP